MSDIVTLTGLALEEAIQLLDQELPAAAYKALPGAVDLTDIDPNWMRKTLNRVFGICGWGWGYEYDPKDLEYRYESRTNSKGNDYGVYVAVLTHLRFWYRLVSNGSTIECSVHATGASENANIAYAMKGALSNALGNAVSNIGFQESVYLGLRSHKDFAPAPNGSNGKPAPAPKQPAPQAAAEAEGELPDPGDFKLTFGKNQGKTLGELWASGAVGQGYVRWLAGQGERGFQPRNADDKIAQRMARAFLTLNAAHAG